MLSQFLLISAVSASVDYRSAALRLPLEFDPPLHRACKENDDSSCRALLEKCALMFFYKGASNRQYTIEKVVDHVMRNFPSGAEWDRVVALNFFNEVSARFNLQPSGSLEDHPVIKRFQQVPEGLIYEQEWLDFWRSFQGNHLHLRKTVSKATARTAISSHLLAEMCNDSRRPVSVCDGSLDMFVRESLVLYWFRKQSKVNWESYDINDVRSVINEELELIDHQATILGNRFPTYKDAASAVPIEFDLDGKSFCFSHSGSCDNLVNRFAAACGVDSKSSNESDESFLTRLSLALNEFDVDLMRVLVYSLDSYPVSRLTFPGEGVLSRYDSYKISNEKHIQARTLTSATFNLREQVKFLLDTELRWDTLLRARSSTDVENVINPAFKSIALGHIQQFFQSNIVYFCPESFIWPHRLTKLAKSFKAVCDLKTRNVEEEINLSLFPEDYIADFVDDYYYTTNVLVKVTNDFKSAVAKSRNLPSDLEGKILARIKENRDLIANTLPKNLQQTADHRLWSELVDFNGSTVELREKLAAHKSGKLLDRLEEAGTDEEIQAIIDQQLFSELVDSNGSAVETLALEPQTDLLDDQEDTGIDEEIQAIVGEAKKHETIEEFQHETKQPSQSDRKLSSNPVSKPISSTPTQNENMKPTLIVAIVVSLVLVLGGALGFLYYRSHNAVTM